MIHNASGCGGFIAVVAPAGCANETSSNVAARAKILSETICRIASLLRSLVVFKVRMGRRYNKDATAWKRRYAHH